MLGAGGAACREGGQWGPEGTAGPFCSGGVRNFICGMRERATQKEGKGQNEMVGKSLGALRLSAQGP